MRGLRLRQVAAVFDVEDVYARDLGTTGRNPRALGRLEFLALARWRGRACEPLDPPVALLARRNPSGFHLFYGQGLSGGEPVRSLAAGVYTVEARSPEGRYQSAKRRVELPSTAAPLLPYRFELLPGYAYPFPTGSTAPGRLWPTLLRGEVLAPDGRGKARAVVAARSALYRYRTDATGQWVLVFPDALRSGRALVRVVFSKADGGTPCVPWSAGSAVQAWTAIVQGETRSLRQTALTGQVVAVSGVPIPGARILVESEERGERYPGEGITDGQGLWSYYFPLDQERDRVTVTAVPPKAPPSSQEGVRVRPRETVTVPTFHAGVSGAN